MKATRKLITVNEDLCNGCGNCVTGCAEGALAIIDGKAKLVNRLSYVPGFQDFGNYHFTHESFYEVPRASPAWKLRLGVSNDYNSKPGSGVDKLDTAYFTRLLLNWK